MPTYGPWAPYVTKTDMLDTAMSFQNEDTEDDAPVSKRAIDPMITPPPRRYLEHDLRPRFLRINPGKSQDLEGVDDHPGTVLGPDGVTFTSPSIYVVYQTIRAYDKCDRLGGEHTNIVFAFKPGELSSIDDFSGKTLSYNFGDLPCPPKAWQTVDWSKRANLHGQYVPFDQKVTNYRPRVVGPESKILALDPLWHTCRITPVDNGYDPPRALAYEGPGSDPESNGSGGGPSPPDVKKQQQNMLAPAAVPPAAQPEATPVVEPVDSSNPGSSEKGPQAVPGKPNVNKPAQDDNGGDKNIDLSGQTDPQDQIIPAPVQNDAKQPTKNDANAPLPQAAPAPTQSVLVAGGLTLTPDTQMAQTQNVPLPSAAAVVSDQTSDPKSNQRPEQPANQPPSPYSGVGGPQSPQKNQNEVNGDPGAKAAAPPQQGTTPSSADQGSGQQAQTSPSDGQKAANQQTPGTAFDVDDMTFKPVTAGNSPQAPTNPAIPGGQKANVPSNSGPSSGSTSPAVQGGGKAPSDPAGTSGNEDQLGAGGYSDILDQVFGKSGDQSDSTTQHVGGSTDPNAKAPTNAADGAGGANTGGQLKGASGNPYPSALAVAGQTVQNGGPPITVSGKAISLGPSALIVGSKTIALPTAPAKNAQAGQPIPAAVFSVAGTGITAGKPAVTVGGSTISLASDSLLVNDKTILLPASSAMTVSGHRLQQLGSTAVSIDGRTVSLSGPAQTGRDGSRFSLGPSGLAINNATYGLGSFVPVTVGGGMRGANATGTAMGTGYRNSSAAATATTTSGTMQTSMSPPPTTPRPPASASSRGGSTKGAGSRLACPGQTLLLGLISAVTITMHWPRV